jgi:D-proline reductase (dithiol) PrdB
VGLVCRVVEAMGIATVCVSTGRDLSAQVKPPRTLFVNHPMGNAFGSPGDVAMQRTILRRALALLVEAEEGGVIVDAATSWPEPFEFAPGSSNM